MRNDVNELKHDALKNDAVFLFANRCAAPADAVARLGHPLSVLLADGEPRPVAAPVRQRAQLAVLAQGEPVAVAQQLGRVAVLGALAVRRLAVQLQLGAVAAQPVAGPVARAAAPRGHAVGGVRRAAGRRGRRVPAVAAPLPARRVRALPRRHSGRLAARRPRPGDQKRARLFVGVAPVGRRRRRWSVDTCKAPSCNCLFKSIVWQTTAARAWRTTARA